MNHQVEHDIDVQGARSKYAEPVHLKEHGPGNDGKSGANCGIEALQVSDLGDAAESLCRADEFVRFRK